MSFEFIGVGTDFLCCEVDICVLGFVTHFSLISEFCLFIFLVKIRYFLNFEVRVPADFLVTG
jgi:hypothetical protein